MATATIYCTRHIRTYMYYSGVHFTSNTLCHNAQKHSIDKFLVCVYVLHLYTYFISVHMMLYNTKKNVKKKVKSSFFLIRLLREGQKCNIPEK